MSSEQTDHPSGSFPDQGRLLGIDFGTVRIGLAICDVDHQFSSPLEVYNRRSPSKDALYFQHLVQQERIAGLVVGLPIHTSGKESQKSKEARDFAKWISDLVGLPVRLIDERFSTSMAREILSVSGMSGKKRKAKLDKIAAHVLLSSFLESPERAVEPGEVAEDALDDGQEAS